MSPIRELEHELVALSLARAALYGQAESMAVVDEGVSLLSSIAEEVRKKPKHGAALLREARQGISELAALAAPTLAGGDLRPRGMP